MEFEKIALYSSPAVLAIIVSILIASLRRGHKKGAEINHNFPESQPDSNLPRSDRDQRLLIFRGQNRGSLRSRVSHGNRYRP